jgi:hypothetical protein
MMKKMLIGAAALVSALTGVLATATPADARDGWRGGGYGYRGGYGDRGGYGYRGDSAGPAIVAGLAGLAIGASLAQPRHYYSGPAYGYGYGYGGPRVVYGPPPAYYVGPTYYGWYEGCRREWVWSPRWGGYRLIDACY